jgi:hypothetical protein
MFDSGVELPAMGASQLAGLIEQNYAELMVRECRMLQLACAWADAHYLDSGCEEYQPLIQRACAWAGEVPRRSRSITPPNSAPCWAPG